MDKSLQNHARKLILTRPAAFVIAAVVLTFLPSSFAFAGQHKFTLIDVPGSNGTEVNGINSQGDVVGEYFDQDGNTHGFLLKNGKFTTIDVPGAVFGTFPAAINPRGDIVGSYNDDNGLLHGFLLSNGKYTTIDVPGGLFPQPQGISPRGDITGFYIDLNGANHGFLISGGKFKTIDAPGSGILGSNGTQLYGINSQGEIVGLVVRDDGTFNGFVFSNGTFTPLDVTGERAINSRGDIAGINLDFTTFSFYGYVLRRGKSTTIFIPGSSDTFLSGINERGDVVGFYFGSTGAHGFLTTAD